MAILPPFPAGGLVLPCFLFFTILAPILLGGALLAPTRGWIAAATAHASLYTGFIGILSIASEPGHSSPSEGFASAIEILLFAISAFELVVIFIAVIRAPPGVRERTAAPWLFVSLTVALLGGWAAGVLGWSETVPARIVSAAEGVAADRPYCLDIVGRPARNRRDLIGISVHAPNNGGFFWAFHALLVAGEGASRSYFNWSYKTGRFEQVNDDARNGLHLDATSQCRPVPHFARELAGLHL